MNIAGTKIIEGEGNAVHVSICICTYKRPILLRRLLERIQLVESRGINYSIVICDNDVKRSAEKIVCEIMRMSKLSITYCCEPSKNIALARNRALGSALGRFIAVIDDDEYPDDAWLTEMMAVCEKYKVAGVLGPVLPHFEIKPPTWIIKGGFCERPRHKTGRVMNWEECRTGNLLFRRSIIADLNEPFNPDFGNGGEDKDFFMRMNERSHQFVWCNEGIVFETVPQERWKPSYMFKRALLRGKNILKHPTGKFGLLLRSVFAIPVYLLVLPFCLLLGMHVFIKYVIKLCDHLGRVLALFGLNPVNER